MEKILTTLNDNIKKNIPTILSSLGVVGLFASVGLTVKATKDYDKDECEYDKKFKKICKHYYPVFVVSVCSAGCIIGANTVSAKRNIILASAYKMSEKKIEKIFDNVKKTNDNNVENQVNTFGDGEIECFDQMSGRYFKSDLHAIRDAVDEINKAMYYGDNGYLNDFYRHLGMDTVDAFEHTVWICDGGPIGLQLSSKLSKSSRPVLVVDFFVKPISELVF